MDFKNQYNKVISVVQNDLDIFEKQLLGVIREENPLYSSIKSILSAPSKRLRPILGMLFTRLFAGTITEPQRLLFVAVELVHSATLIHDDVIDDAAKRRCTETINEKFDDNLAVVAGDYLLALAMDMVIETNSIPVVKLYSSALKNTCVGEINQYFSKYAVPTIEEYIEKSKNKTALLFEIATLAPISLSENRNDEKLLDAARTFSQNFGIAFQIRDDLINTLSDGNDLASGIYTAPIIFASHQNSDILSQENVLECIKKEQGIEKTVDLMDNYFDKALFTLSGLEDNAYKKAIFGLVELLKTSL